MLDAAKSKIHGRGNRRLDAVLDFVAFAAKPMPLVTLLDEAPRRIAQIFDADVCSLYLVEGEGTDLVMRGNGGFSYEYANDLSWEVGPGFYLVAEHEWTTAVRFVVSGENKGRDHQKGTLLNDTALNAVYLGPAVSMTWSDSLHGDLSVELPVEQDTTGKQIVADYRLKAGVSWRF